ncbi:MAG: hypothetical protein ABIR58_00210, partial [Gemmatimonadaceae bacterium]
YGDFISADTLSKGWVTFDSRPRFGTNYFGLRGGISILSEAYSHDPMQRRVAATYSFVSEILSLVAERAPRIRSLSETTGSQRVFTTDAGTAGGVTSERRVVPLRARMVAGPAPTGVVAETIERTGDSARTEPGVPRGRRRTGRFTTVRMPVFDRFVPTVWQTEPVGYVIAPADTLVVALLRRHGVQVETLQREWTGGVGIFSIDSAVASPRLFQGHREMRLEGRWTNGDRRLPAGSFVVRTSQPLGLLAVYLLEPQSDDGVVTWNYFDAAARAGGEFPIMRVLTQLPSSSQ